MKWILCMALAFYLFQAADGCAARRAGIPPPPPPPPPPETTGSTTTTAMVTDKRKNGEKRVYTAAAANGTSRLTGRDFLVREQRETEGYGLYSYLLFASPPANDVAKERYLETIRAFLDVPTTMELEAEGRPPSSLNVTYIPVKEAPSSEDVPAEWVLEHYNYARALIILAAIPEMLKDGPLVVSALQPLTLSGPIRSRYLRQNLSAVETRLIRSWIRLFRQQVCKEEFWKSDTYPRAMLALRTAIADAAGGLEDVKAAIDRWIEWRRRE